MTEYFEAHFAFLSVRALFFYPKYLSKSGYVESVSRILLNFIELKLVFEARYNNNATVCVDEE